MRPSVSVFHPGLGRGGSEARALWLIHALCDRADVTLRTWGHVDFDALNAFYGTGIREGDCRVTQPRGARFLGGKGGNALRKALLQRHLATVDDDLVISAYNLVAYGGRAIHFVADFGWSDELRRLFHEEVAQLKGQGVVGRAVRAAYDAGVRLARGRPIGAEITEHDLVVANSHFTATTLRDHLGIEVDRVIYPPVAGPKGGPPAAEREATFVSLGRISPEKRILEQIEILKRVRARGHTVGLEIYGGPTEGVYAREVRERIASEGPWVEWKGPVQGSAKWDVLRRNRYAIHARLGEAFGISVAEQARAGCLVFVPSIGAPAEIVDHPDLTYDGMDEAVGRISDVLAAEHSQQDLSDHLVRRGTSFGSDRFVAEVQQLVAEVLPAATEP